MTEKHRGERRNEKKLGGKGKVPKNKSLWQNIDRCNEEAPVEDVNTVAHTLAEH